MTPARVSSAPWTTVLSGGGCRGAACLCRRYSRCWVVEFGLDLFDGWQCCPKCRRQGTSQLVARYADRLVDARKCVFGQQAILALAEDQADSRVIRRVAESVVDDVAVEVEFTGIFRSKGARFQFDDHECAKLQMVKEKINVSLCRQPQSGIAGRRKRSPVRVQAGTAPDDEPVRFQVRVRETACRAS